MIDAALQPAAASSELDQSCEPHAACILDLDARGPRGLGDPRRGTYKLKVLAQRRHLRADMARARVGDDRWLAGERRTPARTKSAGSCHGHRSRPPARHRFPNCTPQCCISSKPAAAKEGAARGSLEVQTVSPRNRL